MVQVHIRIADNQDLFFVGDTLKGIAEVTIPESVPISNISLSFHCLGEVKWIEYHGTPHYLSGTEFYDQYDYLEANLPFVESDVTVNPHHDHKTVYIPFSYTIPNDINLPSTMISNQGFIQHFIRATIKLDKDEVKKFVKEVTVHSPMDKNLMITVGASAEKTVLLHAGKVSMHASIGRKGFAPGESITVHIAVNNKTNTKVVPKISLSQVQIYMCGECHKTIETTMNDHWAIGSEIDSHTEVEEVLSVAIPPNESLSIKSTLITVKYFVQVILDIPHAFDLHLSLPIVVTAPKVIEQLHGKKDILVTVD